MKPFTLEPLSDLCAVRNVDERKCQTCGQVHEYISIRRNGVPCDTPAVWDRKLAGELVFGVPVDLTIAAAA